MEPLCCPCPVQFAINISGKCGQLALVQTVLWGGIDAKNSRFQEDLVEYSVSWPNKVSRGLEIASVISFYIAAVASGGVLVSKEDLGISICATHSNANDVWGFCFANFFREIGIEEHVPLTIGVTVAWSRMIVTI